MGGNVIDLILWDLLDSAEDTDESLQVFWPRCLEISFSLELLPTPVLIASTLWPTKGSPVTLIWDSALFRVRRPTSNSSLQRSLGPGAPKTPDRFQVKRRHGIPGTRHRQRLPGSANKVRGPKFTCRVSFGEKGQWVWKRGRAGRYSDLSAFFSHKVGMGVYCREILMLSCVPLICSSALGLKWFSRDFKNHRTLAGIPHSFVK